MTQLDLFTVDLDAFLEQTLGELQTLGIDPKEFAIRFWARQIAQRLEALPSADQIRVVMMVLDLLKLEQ